VTAYDAIKVFKMYHHVWLRIPGSIWKKEHSKADDITCK